MTTKAIGYPARSENAALIEGYANQFFPVAKAAMEIVDLFPVVQIASETAVQDFDLTVPVTDFDANPELLEAISDEAPANAPLSSSNGKITYTLSRYPIGSLKLSNRRIQTLVANGHDPYSDLMRRQANNAMTIVARKIADIVKTATNYKTEAKSTITSVTSATNFAPKIESALNAMRDACTWADDQPLSIVIGYDAAVLIASTNEFKAHVKSQYKSQTNPLGMVEGFVQEFAPGAKVIIPQLRWRAGSATVKAFTNQIAFIPTGTCSLGKLVIPAGTMPNGTGLGSMVEAGDQPLDKATGREYYGSVFFQAKLAIEATATETDVGFLYSSVSA